MCKNGNEGNKGDKSNRDLEENHIWVITGGHKEGYRLQLLINGKPVQMKLDTGATVSVRSEHEWNQLQISYSHTQEKPSMAIQESSWT